MKMEDYNYLLNTNRYALIEVDPKEYVIFDVIYRGVVIIEIEEVASSVIEMMMKNNCKVLRPSDVM
jgi:hypothetical protein